MAPDKFFIKNVRFGILSVVLENTYMEEMIRNEITDVFILETNPFVLKLFTQYLVDGLHLRSKGQGFIIHR